MNQEQKQTQTCGSCDFSKPLNEKAATAFGDSKNNIKPDPKEIVCTKGLLPDGTTAPVGFSNYADNNADECPSWEAKDETSQATWLEKLIKGFLRFREWLSLKSFLIKKFVPEKNETQFTEAYLIIRLLLLLLVLLWLPWGTLPIVIRILTAIVIGWIIIGSLAAPLRIILFDCKKDNWGYHSFVRSFALCFLNYFEIIVGFAYMYLLFDLVKNDSMTPVNTAGRTLYFSVVTITTLGYGDMRPVKPLGLFLTSIEPIMGIVLLVLVMGVFLVKLSPKNDLRPDKRPG